MDVEIVAQGLQFPEGPIAMRDGSVLLVEMRRGTLSRVKSQGMVEIVTEVGGGPNGAAIGPDGAVYICNNGGAAWIERPGGTFFPAGTPADYRGGSIQHVDLSTGAVKTLYAACDGVNLCAPNDIVFDGRDGFWFTDFGKDDERGREYGALYYARADGSAIRRVVANLTTPNGIGLSADGRWLHVAETLSSRLLTFEIVSPGAIRPPGPGEPGSAFGFSFVRARGPLPGYQMIDSLAVEACGAVCVATLVNGAISIYAADGRIAQAAVADPFVTNLCFGGKDMRDVFITGGLTGRLFKARWPRPGLALAFGA